MRATDALYITIPAKWANDDGLFFLMTANLLTAETDANTRGAAVNLD
jgi:hypothetical protein